MRAAELAGADELGLWHYSPVGDRFVDEGTLWRVAALVVAAAADAGVSLPSIGWFAEESASERRYVTAHRGDRPWDDIATAAPIGAVAIPGRIMLDRNVDPAAPNVVAAIRQCVAASANPMNMEN